MKSLFEKKKKFKTKSSCCLNSTIYFFILFLLLLILYIFSLDHQRSLEGCATLTWIEGPAMVWNWICDEGHYVAIKPDKQGFYTATLYTGFPKDSTSPKRHPQSKQAFKWKGTGWIDLNSLGCLSQESLFGPFCPSPA